MVRYAVPKRSSGAVHDAHAKDLTERFFISVVNVKHLRDVEGWSFSKIALNMGTNETRIKALYESRR